MNAEDFFKDLLTDIQVTDQEIEAAREKRDELRANVGAILREFGLRGIGGFAAGALAAGTQIKPLNDVDLVVYGSRQSLPPDWEGTPSKALGDICGRLGEITGYRCEPRAHAVKVTFPDVEFTADVVFGVERSPSGLYIPHCPEEGEHKWIETDPKRHAELVRERNADTNYRFARVVRIMKALNKYWSYQDDEGRKPVSSFHMTALSWWVATEVPSLSAGVMTILDKGSELVSGAIKDPSDVGDAIAAKDPAFASAKFAEARDAVARALQTGDGADQILSEVFGEQKIIRQIFENGPLSIKKSTGALVSGVGSATAVQNPPRTRFGDPEE